MGDFLEKVTARAQAAPALAHRIALYLSNTDKRAVVVEAPDDQYYYAVLLRKAAHQHSVEFFVAQGKGRVVGTLSVLQDLGKLDRSFGVRDRDFDFEAAERMVDGHCLVLDVYSFENYLGDGETLKQAGQHALGLEAGSAELGRWHSVVEAMLGSIPAVLDLEHAQAYWCKVNGKTCHLNNFQPLQAVSVVNTGTLNRTAHTNQRFIDQSSADISAMTAEDTDNAKEFLSAKVWTKRFRGHFFWEFFSRVLNDFRNIIDAEFQHQGRPRVRTRSHISDRHALEAAIPFSPTPPTIASFFELILA